MKRSSDCQLLVYYNKPIRHFSSRIGFDLNSLLRRPGLVESASRAHMRNEWPMAIVGLGSFSCMTLSIGFDLTQCACAHDMLNRLISKYKLTNFTFHNMMFCKNK